MVVLDNSVEEGSEFSVGVHGSSVATDSGVDVLESRVDSLLEGEASIVMGSLALLPDLLGEALLESGFAGIRELGELLDISRGLESESGVFFVTVLGHLALASRLRHTSRSAGGDLGSDFSSGVRCAFS